MSSGFNTIPGNIPAVASTPVIALDSTIHGVANNSSDRTNGFIVSVPLAASPTLGAAWNILAFSVQAKIAVAVNTTTTGQFFAKLGALWAGVLLGSAIPGGGNSSFFWPPASFPPDLSSFTKIWDGSVDNVNIIANPGGAAESDWTLVAQTFQLPFPLQASPGTPLGFALVLTPSLISGNLAIYLKSCTFSVIYEQEETE